MAVRKILTESQIKKIGLDKRSKFEIAKEYGISSTYAYYITRGFYHSDLTGIEYLGSESKTNDPFYIPSKKKKPVKITIEVDGNTIVTNTSIKDFIEALSFID